MTYTDEQIARVCHEANRALQAIHDDPAPSNWWDVESPDIQASVIDGVRKARQGRTPRELHDDWCAYKRAEGWRYGLVKDAVEKTHPCLVPYDDLPPGQRVKDNVFLAIVERMILTG